MKKLFSFLWRGIIPLTGIFVMAFLFSACKKTLDTGTQPPVAGLMAFNLAPDKPNVGVTVDGQNLTSFPLPYTNYTGSYLGIYAGTRTIASYDFMGGTTLATTSQVFADSANYSLFVVEANGTYRNVLVQDKLDSTSSTTGQAYVRYVNAIADSTQQPLVAVSANGTNVFSSTAPFATVSDFKGITPGDISVNVSNEPAINASRTITVEQGKIYTILLVGTPGQTDTTKAVQIKFIQNGVVPTTP